MNNHKTTYGLGETIMITPTKEAYISGICIRKGHTRYEFTYLDDYTQKTDWFDEEHVERILFNTEAGISKDE